MQVPYEDPKSLSAVEAYMSDHKWDGYINLGDFLDLNELSSYNEGFPGRIEHGLGHSIKRANAILDRHCAIIRKRNPHARIVFLEGNHEYRAVAYRDKHTEQRDFLIIPELLKMKERGIEWVPSWSKGEIFTVGKAHFVHGLTTSKYHAAVMAAHYGVSIYYGHTHDVMEHPIVFKGHNDTIVGKSLGCLCSYDQSYLKGAPTKWQQAFATFNFFPDGYYTEHTTRIFKHRFVSPEGKVYSA